MVAATLAFEGNKDDIQIQKKKILAIAAKYGGIDGGAESGRRGTKY